MPRWPWRELFFRFVEKYEFSYENISSIRSFEKAYQTPRREDLNIPYSDIMKNESYKRLLEYSIYAFFTLSILFPVENLFTGYSQPVTIDFIKRFQNDSAKIKYFPDLWSKNSSKSVQNYGFSGKSWNFGETLK